MANDANETVIGANGSVWVAPVGTVAPINPTIAFGTGWLELGYLNEDGLQVTDGKTVQSFMAWQAYYAIRKTISEKSFMVAINLLQWNDVNIPLALGGGAVTTVTTGIYKFEPGDPGIIDERAMAFRWSDGAKHYHLIIPRGLVTENVEFSASRAALSELPLTFEAIASGTAKPYSFLTDDPAFNPA